MVSAGTEPTLIRTSTLLSEYIRQHLDIINTPIQLHVNPSVNYVMSGWNDEELVAGRRLVYLNVARESHANFHIEAESIRPDSYIPNDGRLVISCVKWEEESKFVVTSVDVILVLEHLVGVQFSIEEKSRIRRNLQFLKPSTITRFNNESKRLFNSLMAMDNPRPRNIEKDLKVFEWNELFVAVKKVLSKYSANPGAPTALLVSLKHSRAPESTAKLNPAAPGNQHPLRGNAPRNTYEKLSTHEYHASSSSPRYSTVGIQQHQLPVPATSILELPQRFIGGGPGTFSGVPRTQAKLEREPAHSYLRCGYADNARPTPFETVQA